jgi:kynureninase
MSDPREPAPYPREFRDDEGFARDADARDPLADYRNRFHLPRRADGSEVVYLCGNSLGLQPRAAGTLVEQELEDWARLGLDAHFEGRTPWYSYHEVFRETGARLVGARPGEVVMMNSLTVNLHLMMVSFYRPTARRHKILTDAPTFPSDRFALQSHLGHHGQDPAEALIVARPREGESAVRIDDILSLIDEHGDEIALVAMNAVNYFSGQRFDIARITAAAKAEGCRVGWDLAHAAGNVETSLHDHDVDFAVWCSYKYLNAGPGAVAGCFVHARHGGDAAIPRFAGWWGTDPETRFEMQSRSSFSPAPGAEGWQLSNPPILAMAPLRVSLDMFDEVGMRPLREKSVALTAYLQFLVDRVGSGRIDTLTPRDPGARGCQLSLRFAGRAREVLRGLVSEGMVVDFRDPDVIRVAPVPLYNSFHDVWRFGSALARHLENGS